jgi:hypothetical protein
VSDLTTSEGSIFQVVAVRFGKEKFLMGLLPGILFLFGAHGLLNFGSMFCDTLKKRSSTY